MAALPGRLFFAYGPALSLSEMYNHCPTSSFYGIAILRRHRWIVNERGRANIVPSSGGPSANGDVIWGFLYSVRPLDEEALDKQQGLPLAYSKEDMDVEAVTISEDGRSTRREMVQALVYIDRDRVQESHVPPELAIKLNQGLQDAVERGIPASYVDRVVRSRLMNAPPPTDGIEPRNGSVAAPATHSGTSSAPSKPRQHSDSASPTHAGEDANRSRNGTGHRSNPSPYDRARGLQDSRFAHENDFATQPRAWSRERETSAPQSDAPPRPQASGNKRYECWWWKTQGECRKSEQECAYAHYETGFVAAPPGKKAKGFWPVNGQRAARADGESSRHRSARGRDGANNHDASSVHSRSHSATDHSQTHHHAAHAGAGSFAEPYDPSPPVAAPAEKDPTWGGDSNGPVENLMDSQPEWLVSNQRSDVQW